MPTREEVHEQFHKVVSEKMRERGDRMSVVVKAFYKANQPDASDYEIESMEAASCCILSIIRLLGRDDNHELLSIACRCVLACMVHTMIAHGIAKGKAIERAQFIEGSLDVVDDEVAKIDIELGIRRPEDYEQDENESRH